MSYTLLIVDDSKLARMSAGKALSALYPDWTRIEAKNAEEAMTLAKDAKFDVALLDFNMPGRDGLQLAAEIKSISPLIPLALVSANHQEEIVTRARTIGATFLPKPLTEQALSAFLSDAVKQLKSVRT
jgi:CheY-like chemotaxis protein